MQALIFGGVETILNQTVPEPKILQPTDAIVQITLSSICGSDLHVYHGRETGLDEGTVMGHEFVGTIVETGNVRGFRFYKCVNFVVSNFNCRLCF